MQITTVEPLNRVECGFFQHGQDGWFSTLGAGHGSFSYEGSSQRIPDIIREGMSAGGVTSRNGIQSPLRVRGEPCNRCGAVHSLNAGLDVYTTQHEGATEASCPAIAKAGKGLQMNTAPEKESLGLWRVPQIGGLSVSVRDIVRLMRCARQSNPTHSKSCCHYAPDFCTRKASWNQSVIFRAKILSSAQVGQVDTTRAKPKRSYVSPSTGTPCPPRCRPRGGLLCLSGSQASAASTPCSCARTDRS